MTKSDNSIESVENYRRIDHLIIIELTQIAHLRNSSLVVPKIIMFQPHGNVLQNFIDNTDDKLLVVAVKGARKNSEEIDIVMLDLPRLCEYFRQNISNLATVRGAHT